MPTSIDDNARAREAILGRIRIALRKAESDHGAGGRALAVVDAHAQGPRPRLPSDLVTRFLERATDMASSVERLRSLSEVPRAVARYLDALELPPAIAEQKSHRGVCWPEFEQLDWSGAGLAIEARPTFGEDRLGITGCLCAIAETGTLVVISGADTPVATTLLPDTHVAVVRESDVVSGMEEAMDRVRAVSPEMPRGVHLISGPSRTGDIEQTIVLGAHGPYRVHILLVP
jgi:L-lactate dehydrogenase complex protein LldG